MITIEHYTVRKFTIKEYADLSTRFKAVLPLLDALTKEEDQLKSIGSLIATCLPELITAVHYATDKELSEIEKIDDMNLFVDLLIAIKTENNFLELKATAQRAMTNLFQS